MAYEVNYRQITIQDSEDKIVGFAFWYQDLNAAHVFLDSILRHFQARERKTALVEFMREEDTYGLEFTIFFDSSKYSVRISGIAPNYVEELRETLREYPYLPILVGYTDDCGKHQFIENNYYNVSQIFIDGSLLIGSNNKRFPLDLLEGFVSKQSHEQ